jgi:hypothetical protein
VSTATFSEYKFVPDTGEGVWLVGSAWLGLVYSSLDVTPSLQHEADAMADVRDACLFLLKIGMDLNFILAPFFLVP